MNTAADPARPAAGNPDTERLTPMPTPDPIHDLTPEQLTFLRAFADNANTGRRVLCGIVHMLVALGTAAGAVAGIFAAVQAWHGR